MRTKECGFAPEINKMVSTEAVARMCSVKKVFSGYFSETFWDSLFTKHLTGFPTGADNMGGSSKFNMGA